MNHFQSQPRGPVFVEDVPGFTSWETVSPSLSLSEARRALWPFVTGSRAQKKLKVHALIRLGYRSAPTHISDSIQRNFQVRAVLRHRLHSSRRPNKPLRFLKDEFSEFLAAHS